LTGRVRETPTPPRGEALLASAGASLQRAQAFRNKGDHGRAFNEARQAARALDQVQRLDFERVVQVWGSPVSSPLAVSYTTLPDLKALAEQLQTSRLGHNRLSGGDFEDLAELRRAGWQHYRHPVAGLRTEVSLTPTEPHSGRFSLRLSASAEGDARTAPYCVVTPPVWVTSPPVQVPSGQLIRIHGWVRVPRLDTGSDDGLLIVDSLAGEASAERIGPTHEWRELTLYRIAPPSGIATITFALSGYGQAEIDGVTIAPVEFLARNGPAHAGTVDTSHYVTSRDRCLPTR
jgi:hypothetical protein